jgi:hypothetical protein
VPDQQGGVPGEGYADDQQRARAVANGLSGFRPGDTTPWHRRWRPQPRQPGPTGTRRGGPFVAAISATDSARGRESTRCRRHSEAVARKARRRALRAGSTGPSTGAWHSLRTATRQWHRERRLSHSVALRQRRGRTRPPLRSTSWLWAYASPTVPESQRSVLRARVPRTSSRASSTRRRD